jgi:hypothetical protein
MANDVSISIGLDYAAFVSQANGASRKVLEQSLRQFSVYAKQASQISGASAGRATAATRLLGSLASPVTAPFTEAKQAMATTVAVAVQAARQTSSVWNSEMVKIRTAWIATTAVFAGATLFQRARMAAGFRQAFAPVGVQFRSQMISLGVWLANTFPNFWARAMRTFPKLDQWLHKAGAGAAGMGPTLLTPFKNALVSGIRMVTLPLENHFPKVFAGLMRNVPSLDRLLHGGKVTAGGGPGIFSKIAFAFRPLIDMLKPAALLVGTVLTGAFRVLGTVAVGVVSIITTALRGMLQVITSVASSVLTLGLVVGTVFAIGIARAIGYGKELDALSRRYQFAVKDIEAMRLALYRSGQTAASTAGIMGQLYDNLRFGAGPGLLQNLGFDLPALQQLFDADPTAAFAKIAEVVNSIENYSVRARVATTLLGQAGAEALAQFQKGDADLSPAMRKYIEDIDRGASALQMAADHWRRIKLSAQVFFNSVAAKIAPVMETVARYFETKLIPLAETWGALIGAKLKTAFDIVMGLFTTGTLLESLKLSFEIGARYFANLMIQAITFTGKLLWRTLVEAFKVLADESFLYGLLKVAASFGQLLIDSAMALGQLLLEPSLYLGMGKMLVGVVAQFGSALIDAINGVLTLFRDGMQFVMEKIFARFTPGMKASSFDEIRAENQNQRILPDQTASRDVQEKLKGSALADFQAAVAGITVNPTARAKATAQDALADFAKVDFAGFMGLLKKIPELWAGSAKDLFDNRELVAKLSKLLTDAQQAGAGTTAGTGAGTKPGSGPGPAIGMVQTRFDDLRRVGAGLSASAGSSMQSIAEKQLTIQQAIEKNTRSFRKNRPDAKSITSFSPIMAG